MRAHVAAVVLGIAFPSDMMPPPKYRSNDRTAIVTVSSQADVDRLCGKAAPPNKTAACARVSAGYIVMPNPCRFAEKFPNEELYAVLLCHEIAHMKGWRHPK